MPPGVSSAFSVSSIDRKATEAIDAEYRVKRPGAGEGLPPHVESYREDGRLEKVALRVSVETFDIAWLCGAEPTKFSRVG
jgi:hypothetical protein